MTGGTSSRNCLSLPVMEHFAPHLIAHLGGLSYTLFPEFPENIFDGVDGLSDRTFGTAAHLGNLRIAEIIQRIEQEPLPLGGSAESQHRQNFIQRFPLADQFFRRGAVG